MALSAVCSQGENYDLRGVSGCWKNLSAVLYDGLRVLWEKLFQSAPFPSESLGR